MSISTIGWVMDKDTSTRRLRLGLADAGVELRVEVSGQPPATMTLDAEGVATLHNLVQRAILYMHDAGEGR
jgi:hypothetical protein